LVCGTSIGALVGAAYAAGELERFEQWALGLRFKDVVAFLDVSLSSGLFKGERMMDFFRRNFKDRPIEELAMPFAAVATSLRTGAEVWLRQGSTLDAVRASIALPGFFAPALREGSVVVDGGLVNPVPVSLARAMGADVVIAVDLGTDILGRHLRAHPLVEAPAGEVSEWIRTLQGNLGAIIPAHSPDEPKMPSMLDVLTTSINIMQVRISRSRMAGEPPTWSWRRGWLTLACSTFTGQRKRSRKASARWSESRTIFLRSAIKHHERDGAEPNAAADGGA
jgi:NTE family protein